LKTITINSIDELKQSVGRTGESAWVTVTQEMINQFATLTLDEQWIHVDVERAQRESPFLLPGTSSGMEGGGTTVAHGFLTLSLLSHFLGSAVQLPAVKAAINYGCDKLRFVTPVPAGARVRGVVTLAAVEEAPGMLQLRFDVVIEVEYAPRPAVIAAWLTRLVP
jgi:acyl dehydratase